MEEAGTKVERAIEWPETINWTDDGQGDVKTSYGGPDGVPVFSLQTRVADPALSAAAGYAAIDSLVYDMIYKLEMNKRKPCELMAPEETERKWAHCDLHWLVSRIGDELSELEEWINAGDLREAQLECADIANFAMMVHDNLDRLLSHTVGHESPDRKNQTL